MHAVTRFTAASSTWPNTRHGLAMQSLLGAPLCHSIYARATRKAVLLDMCARLGCVPHTRRERTVSHLVQCVLRAPGAIFKNWERKQAHAILRVVSKHRRLARAQRRERDLRRRVLLCYSRNKEQSSASWRMVTCHVCSQARAINAVGFPTCKNRCSFDVHELKWHSSCMNPFGSSRRMENTRCGQRTAQYYEKRRGWRVRRDKCTTITLLGYISPPAHSLYALHICWCS